MKTNSLSIWRSIVKMLAVIAVRYLQKRYKVITLKNKGNRTNQVIDKLVLIQSILHYLKAQFSAWGYFHPSCVWSETDEAYLKRLFPPNEFEEIDIVLWYHPNAVTYYKNCIWKLSKGHPPNYAADIKKHFKPCAHTPNWN